jgi:hypothetical protein
MGLSTRPQVSCVLALTPVRIMGSRAGMLLLALILSSGCS